MTLQWGLNALGCLWIEIRMPNKAVDPINMSHRDCNPSIDFLRDWMSGEGAQNVSVTHMTLKGSQIALNILKWTLIIAK